MSKRRLGPTTSLFPMPALLVAVRTGEGSANVLTIAWASVVSSSPPMVALEIGQSHYSTPHINREGCFSVNIPSSKQVVGADYCGLVSGRVDPDKPGTCGWTMVPATLISAPLIAECPLNLECRVTQQAKVGSGVVYYAEVLETHVDQEVISGEKVVDARALDPLVFTQDGYYHKLGERIGKAWEIGKELQG